MRFLRRNVHSILFVAAMATTALPASAYAAGEVVFGCWGGASQARFQEKMLPPFEKANNVKVRYVPGVSTYFTSQMQAQRNAPELDVVCQDDGPQSVARELGLLAPIDETTVPNLKNVVPAALGVDNIGVGYGMLAMGIVYSPEALEKAGVEPPKSWNDLADPRFKGRIVMSSIDATPGLFALLMLAKANGGDVNNITPGFEKMKEVSENVIEFTKGADFSQYFQQGEAWVTVWTNSEMARFVNSTGFKLNFVYPTEGAPIVMPMLNLVKNGPNPEMGQKLIDYLMSDEMQTFFARESRIGPSNKNVVLPADVAEGLTYGDEAISKLDKPDWSVINANRAAWTERWNREIER
ncbi:putative spermidine/putrescine transport system substrate-binding protein [Mesorhizobium sp. J18]|uniref:ABC transporter substrate-binding protein n=1 Tax=Mesorhizobium sp. J18 TaxID=935263 RepID=UPI0011994EFD|nr:ABC transporter substrate-binding protein [Mesorhizobium sp. J18]TWG91789.1 putative spermidine/putrescine transport system substrate-binding protein [Mesorhizobium sp. J18]